MDPIVQITVLFGGSLGAAVLFGLYIARMISFEMRTLEKPLAKIENGFFKLIRIDVNQQMTWKEYLFALLLTDGRWHSSGNHFCDIFDSEYTSNSDSWTEGTVN